MAKKRRPRPQPRRAQPGTAAPAPAPKPPAAARPARPAPKPRERRWTSRTLILALVAAVGAILTVLVLVKLEGRPFYSDSDLYRGYAHKLLAGQVPYRDYRLEYPPGALIPFVIPELFTSTMHDYITASNVMMAALLAIASVLVVLALELMGAPARRMAFAVAGLWGGILLLGPFVLRRFDLYVATLTLAATCAILFRRKYLGSVLLGLSISTKLYPAALLPLFVIRTARVEGRTAALRTLGVTVGTAVLVYLPFLALAPGATIRSTYRQAGRGLQIESFGSGVLIAIHHVFGMPLGWTNSARAQILTGAVANTTEWVTTILALLALLLVWFRFHREDPASDAGFARYAAAAVLAFVAFAKVLSPQFVLWPLVAVVLVLKRRGTAAIALVVAACALTRVWFPHHYIEMVTTFRPKLTWALFFRDLALVAAFVTLVVPDRLPSIRIPRRAEKRAPAVAPTIRSRRSGR